MKQFSIFVIIVVGIVFGIYLWWLHEIAPANSHDITTHQFVVDKGEGTRQIGTALQQAGLIKNSWAFYFLVKLGKYDNKIQAGDYELSKSESTSDIIQALTKGTMEIWVTVPEGQRADEIAQTLQQKLPTYDVSWKSRLENNEGYLFPDTYLFPKDTTVDQVIGIMRGNFATKYQEAVSGQTAMYPQEKAVILASLVQREGKTDADMKYIASVLENRLSLGMALQVDASVQYIIGNSANWWPQPTSDDLQIASSYNTYKNPGLPPTPISNPGLIALQAVFHPAKTNYLFYFTDKKGVTHFAETLDQQNENIRRFGI